MARHLLMVNNSIEVKLVSAEQVWPIRHIAMWPEADFSYIKLPEDPKGMHFGLLIDGELISVVSLFDRGSGVFQFRKFATLPEHQGNGYGSLLLKHMLQHARHMMARQIWCNARTHKQRFYEKFGFKSTGETFIKKDQAYTIMALNGKEINLTGFKNQTCQV
ncbi:GNAT family N-acetyltransferase [Sediminicola luteus]|uniref:GNAT family N-acetyltransferase n=1 Tax=Sediminicola luteus TaxID=319238 RepID=UPI001FE34A15|nr:GNAT family N-acetyltransferase [Sediminicola luteus]